MISLDVQDYCQNCPDFKPYCNKFESEAFHDNLPVHNVDTIIQCKRKDRCEAIHDYICVEETRDPESR